jgi:hypothetical protein
VRRRSCVSHLMLTAIDLRKIRCFDGLHYSFQLLRYFESTLWDTCCKIPNDNSQIISALASCWGFIDAVHRIREISQAIPGVSAKHAEMRAFLAASSLAEDYRHYIQHLRGELSKPSPNSFPVWGSLSWVDPIIPTRTHIAALGAQISGTNNTGCVYDTWEKKWVSKVCLGVDNHSFNFDTVYSASLRFESFILTHLTEGAPPEVQFHDKLPIVTVDVVDLKA